MRFWDSSAIVPLLVDEASSDAVLAEYLRDPDVVAWWATEVECVSALARLEREGALEPSAMTEALARLGALAPSWQEVQPTVRVRESAVRVLRVHPLRAGDAFQLAAAIVASEGSPPSLPFVCLDERLSLGAEREGFPVVRLTA
jgi:predicted nucleic acid-binding protein